MRSEWIAERLPQAGPALDLGFAGAHSEAVHRELRRRRPDLAMFGLDLNAERVLKIRLPRTLIGDAFRLPFSERTFKAVVLGEVLEHLLDPLAVLPEVRRVLKVDGSLIITTPNPYELTRWWRHWLTARDPATAQNVRGYLGSHDHKGLVEPMSFCASLRRNGLEPVALETVKFHVPFMARLFGRPLILRGGGLLLNRLGAYLCIEARRVH